MHAAATTPNYNNYFSEVEEAFVARRGRALLLSPKDWDLIDQWKKSGIPLHIVIRSINEVFDKKHRDGSQVYTLHYCKHAVESNFKAWAASQVGKSGDDAESVDLPISPETISKHIDAAIAALNWISNNGEAVFLKDVVLEIILQLEVIATEQHDDLEALDRQLLEIEDVLAKALLERWDANEIAAIKSEVTGNLISYKADMTETNYNETFDRMLLKRLREIAGIPRLGLFYL